MDQKECFGLTTITPPSQRLQLRRLRECTEWLRDNATAFNADILYLESAFHKTLMQALVGY